MTVNRAANLTVPNILKNESNAKSSLVVIPDVIYSIEKAAFGKASSSLSEAYEVSAIKKAKLTRGVSTALLGVSIGTVFIGVFTGLFGHYLRRRLTRIRSLYPIEIDSKRGASND